MTPPRKAVLPGLPSDLSHRVDNELTTTFGSVRAPLCEGGRIGKEGAGRRTVGGFATCKLSVDCRVSSLPRQPARPPPASTLAPALEGHPPPPARVGAAPRTLSVSSVETPLCVRGPLRATSRGLYTRPLGEIGWVQRDTRRAAPPPAGSQGRAPRAALKRAGSPQLRRRVHDAEERARHFVRCGCCGCCGCVLLLARGCSCVRRDGRVSGRAVEQCCRRLRSLRSADCVGARHRDAEQRSWRGKGSARRARRGRA
jgi:hypothetical protein